MWGIRQPANGLHPVLTPDGSSFYLWSNVPEGFGGADLWQVDLMPLVDLNGDGKVDPIDEEVLQRHWGQDERSCDIGPTPAGDGVIDEQDLAVLTAYMGTDVNDPTLVSYWPLDETEGSTAHDEVGSMNGSLYYGPVWQPEGGILGGALEFDGSNDCVRIVARFNPADGPFSVLAWVKGGAPGQVIFSQRDGTDWLAADSVEGRLTTGLGPTPSRYVTVPVLMSETVITDGNWHRVGFAWDGIERSICVDDSDSVDDAQTQLQGVSKNLRLGYGCDSSPGTYWSGLIDEVRFYNRAVRP